jgi:UDP-N-acetylglucosamine--N-acetylmuramyl-(pentapeptide) pyrophosphoryl-undecaprenol N-acetylglucosamine transferase
MSTSSPLIILSAGGTGGHITPAQALGHDLLSRGFRVELITDVRGQKYAPMFTGIPMHVVASGTLGKGLWGKFSGLSGLGRGVVKALSLLRKRKPVLVIGFGGYPSVPGVYAAQRLKIPTIIHEQNAILGRANAFLSRRADRIALSWAEVQGLDEAEKARAIVTGNPVRADIAALFTQPYPNIDQSGPLRVFIMGGSLGAKVFSDVIPKVLASLSAEYKARLNIIQQCREEQLEATRAAYKEAGIKAELASFFDNVADQLSKAHLVIARSGASTVAEVTTAGRPAIFVPYPHHKDQQQKMNADAVGDAGGAWVMTEGGFTAEALLARIETFLQNPSILFRAAEKARACGKPDAARLLGNLVTETVSDWKE